MQKNTVFSYVGDRDVCVFVYVWQDFVMHKKYFPFRNYCLFINPSYSQFSQLVRSLLWSTHHVAACLTYCEVAAAFPVR